MVNSQTKISLESFHTVVPPRIDLFWLVMLTETVDQSQVQKILKFLTDFPEHKGLCASTLPDVWHRCLRGAILKSPSSTKFGYCFSSFPAKLSNCLTTSTYKGNFSLSVVSPLGKYPLTMRNGSPSKRTVIAKRRLCGSSKLGRFLMMSVHSEKTLFISVATPL